MYNQIAIPIDDSINITLLKRVLSNSEKKGFTNNVFNKLLMGLLKNNIKLRQQNRKRK